MFLCGSMAFHGDMAYYMVYYGLKPTYAYDNPHIILMIPNGSWVGMTTAGIFQIMVWWDPRTNEISKDSFFIPDWFEMEEIYGDDHFLEIWGSYKGPLNLWFNHLPLFFCLVVTGTMEFYDFPFSWEWKIIPTDFRIFFRGEGQPPTSFCSPLMHTQPQPVTWFITQFTGLDLRSHQVPIEKTILWAKSCFFFEDKIIYHFVG